MFVIATIALAVIMAITPAFSRSLLERTRRPMRGIAVAGNFAFLNVLLAGWSCAQLVSAGTTIGLYRRGA